MIQNIEIQNFRCFEQTKITGFERVNLIGGQNNSGKTALLEALYLGGAPIPHVVIFLRQLRRESPDFLKKFPGRAWNNFFFNQRKDHPAIISLETGEGINQIALSCLIADTFLLSSLDEGNREDGLTLSSSSEHALKSELLLCRNDERLFNIIAFAETGIQVESLQGSYSLENINFSSTGSRLSNVALAQEYDKAALNDTADRVLEAIKIIDPAVQEAKTFSVGEPALYLKRAGETFLPISLYGEAVTRVVEFILRLVNNSRGILLIDEVENGIHYTNHRPFWEMLFKVAAKFEAQIFATTHSLEMIQAFAEVGLAEGDGAYFELARNPRTDRITGIKREMDTLAYALNHGAEVRGG